MSSSETTGDEAMRRVFMYKGEDGYWVVECPSLPGCVSQGRTEEEALVNIKEAIEGYVLSLQDDGIDVPKDDTQAVGSAVLALTV
jgi:predicted RNase H-like HicB family nuclease